MAKKPTMKSFEMVDKAADKKAGIKENSPKDKAMDRKAMKKGK
jgi:hypothetical protein